MSEPAPGPEALPGVGLRVSLFVLALLAAFVLVCEYVSRFQPPPQPELKGVSIERGRAVFWGKGQCHTCHRIEGKGASVRGPNLGDWPERKLPAIGARAALRAAERRAQGKEGMTPAEYLIEAVTRPQAYLVEGFGAAMPVVWRPPIALVKEDLLSVLLYLESQDGAPDPASLRLPADVERGLEEVAAGGGARADDSALPFHGDAAAGRRLFFDEVPEKKGAAACASCHAVELEGKKLGRSVCPDLTGIAARQPAAYLVESVLEPSKVIVSGYEQFQVDLRRGGAPVIGLRLAEDAESVTMGVGADREERIRRADIRRLFNRQDLLRVRKKDGTLVVGVRRAETESELTLEEDGGAVSVVKKAETKSVTSLGSSAMPATYAESLTTQDFVDLVEFLRTLR
ncbi:MAG: c-type cytochrome [Planctomycetes bacterium]|nr:c-type cytochrome [Planctomycetota bacterium]